MVSYGFMSIKNKQKTVKKFNCLFSIIFIIRLKLLYGTKSNLVKREERSNDQKIKNQKKKKKKKEKTKKKKKNKKRGGELKEKKRKKQKIAKCKMRNPQHRDKS